MNRVCVLWVAVLLAAPAASAERSVTLHAVDAEGVGEAIGDVHVSESPYGLVFRPDLEGLPPGLRGFHLHEHALCEPDRENGEVVAAGAAGDHYDPDDTGFHDGPWGAGHRGDLPALHVDEQGRAVHPVLAPRLAIVDLSGRSLVIHAGGDTYTDDPEDGGGGDRIACGSFD